MYISTERLMLGCVASRPVTGWRLCPSNSTRITDGCGQQASATHDSCCVSDAGWHNTHDDRPNISSAASRHRAKRRGGVYYLISTRLQDHNEYYKSLFSADLIPHDWACSTCSCVTRYTESSPCGWCAQHRGIGKSSWRRRQMTSPVRVSSPSIPLHPALSLTHTHTHTTLFTSCLAAGSAMTMHRPSIASHTAAAAA